MNFEQWVTNRFGARLYRIFFKTYTEKVWGMPCHEISADWAAQRIKGLSLSTAVGNALKRMLGIKRGGKGAKSLIEAFYYPRQGPGMMWEAAMRAIQQKGSRVQLGSGVEKLEWEAQAGAWRVTYRQQGISKSVSARHIISTMPLRELLHAVSHATEQVCTQAGQLQYRDFLIVSLVLEDKGAFNDNWLYIHDPDVKVGRIQNFKSWSADMVPDDNLVCYGMEYFCFEGDGLWAMEDAQLIDLATQELRMLGLSQDNPVLHGYVTRQRKAYPVYDEHYYERVQSIRSWLEAYCPNLQMVGRNGMHKYNNQDHSMMTALLAARNILAGERCYDVWNVNEDAEYHEEIAVDHGGRQVPTTV